MAMHSCDNRRCVNPNHLRWGSHRENMDDATAGRRMNRLDPETEEAIRADVENGLTSREIAAKRGVNRNTVGTVLDRLDPDRPPISSGVRGEKNAQARLTADQVRAIRADPRPEPAIAETYGVSRGAISHIKLRQTWARLE